MADNVGADPRVSSASSAPALDELMLAMDVVDTLRHKESVALRELAQDGRDESLKERLRNLYESQGLEVSDRILEEGLIALRESRFSYIPTAPGLKRTLAGLWIRRGTFAKVIGIIALLMVAWIGWSWWQEKAALDRQKAAHIELTETLPRDIEVAAKRALTEAKTTDAIERAQEIYADAQAALARSDAEAARVGLAALKRLNGELLQTYNLRIIARPNELSGVYRIPDINTGARNYYAIVEAVKPDGSTLSLPILNEETGKIKTVSKWGVRIPESVYNAIRDDKLDDGILQNNILGIKQRGSLKPNYLMSVSGGAITDW